MARRSHDEPDVDPTVEQAEMFLVQGLTRDDVVRALRSQNHGDRYIDDSLAAYDEVKRKLYKFIGAFVKSIREHHSSVMFEDLIGIGLAYANRKKFTQYEKLAFINYIKNNSIERMYHPYSQTIDTKLFKLLDASQVGVADATDHSYLNEIANMYRNTLELHNTLKYSISTYDARTLPAIVQDLFDMPSKLNPSAMVHPVVFAMFAGKIRPFEHRMLISNIGRMVIARAYMYFSQGMGGVRLQEMTQCEGMADNELAFDATRDPNNMSYLSEESSVGGLVRRFAVQIELWKTVLSLRRGFISSKSEMDGISTFPRVLQQFNAIGYDMPIGTGSEDAVTYMRRLLSVFSYRPMLVEYRNVNTAINLNDVQIDAGRINFGQRSTQLFPSEVKHVTTPMINVWLGKPVGGGPAPVITRAQMFSQDDFIFEEGAAVRMHKRLSHAEGTMIINVNRQYQDEAQTGVKFTYMYMYNTAAGITGGASTLINHREVDADSFMFNAAGYPPDDLSTLYDPAANGDTYVLRATICHACDFRNKDVPGMINDDNHIIVMNHTGMTDYVAIVTDISPQRGGHDAVRNFIIYEPQTPYRLRPDLGMMPGGMPGRVDYADVVRLSRVAHVGEDLGSIHGLTTNNRDTYVSINDAQRRLCNILCFEQHRRSVNLERLFNSCYR